MSTFNLATPLTAPAVSSLRFRSLTVTADTVRVAWIEVRADGSTGQAKLASAPYAKVASIIEGAGNLTAKFGALVGAMTTMKGSAVADPVPVHVPKPKA